MRALLVNSRAAASVSIAGEWSLYVCVLLSAYIKAGRPGAFAYFGACVLAWLLASPVTDRISVRVALVLNAAAGLVAVLMGPRSPWLYIAAGAAYGASAKLNRRVPGPCAGIFGPPGWAGVAGASTAVVSLLIWDPATVAVASATAGVFGAILSTEVQDAVGAGERAEAPRVISYAAVGLCFAAGIRAAEPGMGVDPESALFFVPAWAVGAQLVSAMASTADPRAVLSAPFVASIALAAMGPVEGPGLLFLYMGVGASVALVTGWLGKARWQMAVALIAGAVWGSFGGADFDMTVWIAGAAALAGGFATLMLAYRVPESAPVVAQPTLPPAPRPEIQLAEATPQPEPIESQDVEVEAALILRNALAEARQIREEALNRFRVGKPPSVGESVERAKDRARNTADELEARLESLAARIAR